MGATAVTQVTTLNNLSGGAAVIRKFSTELRRKAIPKSIYVNIRGETVIYKGQYMAIPNGIYTKIKASDKAGANNIRVTLKMPLNGNILRGRTVAVGTEVAPVIRTGTLYRANYRFVVQDEPGYHEDRLDAAPYRLYQEHVRDLAPHASAEEDLEIHMALVETYGWNMLFGSTALTCPAMWNRNCYVIGAPLQPAFHPNLATYTNRIVSAMNNASGGNGAFAQTASQMLSGNTVDNIIRWAFRRRMTPLVLEGRHAYVLTVSQLGAQRFSDPFFTDSMGARWVTTNRIQSQKVQMWNGLLGKYVSPSATVYVVVDDRLPTLLPSGSAEPFGLIAGYIWPTDNDLRNLDNTTVRDAMILHGAGAIVNWEAEAMRLIEDDYDYKLNWGKGYAGVRGIQQLQFDTTPAGATGATREYHGSALIIGGRYESLSGSSERIIESTNP